MGFFNHPGDNILTITASGDVGIGNDAPFDSFKLNVSGNVYIGDDKDITPKDGGDDGQLLINGNGYTLSLFHWIKMLCGLVIRKFVICI